jgi:ribonuclease HI
MTREAWTKGTGPPPVVKGLVWYTDGSRMQDGITGAGVYGQPEGRRLNIYLGKYVTVFQAEIFAILACVYEIQNRARSEKYISICSDSQAALEALHAMKMTSPVL